MSQHKQSPFSLSLKLFPIFFFLFLLFDLIPSSSSSDEVDARYTKCVPVKNLTCGSYFQKITYPFRVGGVPDYCAYPGFKIECQDKSLIMEIGNQTYKIYDINYDVYTINIVSLGFPDGPCLPQNQFPSNSSLDFTFFNLTDYSQNATLFYDCSLSNSSVHGDYNFTCPPLNSIFNNNFGFMAVTDEQAGQFRELCRVEAYIYIMSVGPSIEPGGLGLDDLVNLGFDLTWRNYNNQCNDCWNSGGRCGYNQTLGQPVCFCKGGPYSKTCTGSKLESDQPLSPTPAKKKKNKSFLVPVVIGVVIIVAVGIGLFVIITKRKMQGIESVQTVSKDDLTTVESLQYELAILQAATDGFSSDHKIGEGGFGGVYKGTLPTGQEVAVKRLSKNSGQGDNEFRNEVVLVAKLQHRNLVRLLGFCLVGEEKLLVYEFASNKSLDYMLFNSSIQGDLNWSRRYNIIKGIARGMLYLHEDSRLKIIHRDLKAANILLDSEMNPKISDFGMARMFDIKQVQDNTKRIVGTYGYMAPEYAMHGQFSVKSDVYSFGVLVLEIVSGRKISSFQHSESGGNLISYAWKHWTEGRPLGFMDSTLSSDSYSEDEVTRCIHLGLLCVQDDIRKRPNMATIVYMLDRNSATSTTLSMPEPPAYALTYQNESQQSTKRKSNSNSTGWSQNEITITDVDPR